MIIPQLLHVADGDLEFKAVNFSFGDLFTGEVSCVKYSFDARKFLFYWGVFF